MIDLSVLDRHQKIGLCHSGGKDSIACLYLLREQLDRITVYHLNTGDFLPEMNDYMAEVEALVPHFVRVQTDVASWIDTHGLPTDLLSHTSHPLGEMMGEPRARLVPRYDCCWHNRMLPLFQRMHEDGITLIIRGTKRSDMKRLPRASGDTWFGMELWCPLEGWTNDQVLAFLRLEGVKVPRLYNYVDEGPDCARCSAWWSEGRGAYLKEFYPELWRDYDARLQVIIDEIAPTLALLRREAGAG
jgi:3'-phosphoadenosine 5'-phosphosulfate sulfotransferase (PAPS reductase)/FAD synthetase